MSTPPIPAQWDGEAWRPLPRFAKLADEHYVIGEVYRMLAEGERSEVSHRHEFAWLREAWRQMPDQLAEQYPSPEHLRKRGLIAAGFYDEQVIDAGTNAAAIRVAQGIRARPGEEFSMVVVRGPLVVIRTAKSQSRRAMKGDEFQRSKTALIETVSDLLGVTPDALARSAKSGVND